MAHSSLCLQFEDMGKDMALRQSKNRQKRKASEKQCTFKWLNSFTVFTAVLTPSLPGYGLAGEAARGTITQGA